MNLTELFRNLKLALVEGGNLEIDNPNFDPNQPESPTNAKVIQAQEIQLAPTKISDEVQDRTHMVGVLKNLFMDINKTFTVIYKTPLFDPAILDKEIKEFMAGSSQHFFDLLRPNPNFNPKQPESENNPKMVGLSDEEFKKYKPTVGDIDIQCNQDLKEKLFEFLTNHINVPIGNETLLGAPSAGNEQYNTLWQLADPPIKLQIDFEYGKYSPITQKPDEWTKFSHSSSWEDIQQNIKGVFHKYIYRALAKAAPEAKYIARLSGLGKKRAMGLFGGSDAKEQFTDVNNPPAPFIDANFSFSVASKGGGGVRAKYKPVEPGSSIPTEINGLPVMYELKSGDSEYEQDLNKQFVLFFGKVPQGNDRKLQDSFVGTLELMNKYLDDNGKRNAASDFFDIVFEPGSQMLTKGDPQRDYATKFAAIDKMLAVLGLEDMKQTAKTMAQEYEQDYNDVEAFRQANPNVKQPRAAMRKQRDLVKEDAQVKAQFRKGMPHLHDLKPADLLDLLDEIHDGNGNFKLQNIPLNVKVDGFGGRFGKNADGKPFMGTSNTEPRYAPGFVAYHQKKGTTDPEVLGRAQLFDKLFTEMMNAVKLVDSKLGPGFLVNKQVTCEVLYLPFATETPEGKLKFVGIHYDKLPAGVKLALVPFRITDATTGDDLPNSTKIVKELISAGGSGSVMFIDNSLTQSEALDVTALVPPVENIEQLKAMLASNKLEARRQVKAALEPVAIALEKAIINDPNIIGKELLGQDYEGIVINSRLGPIKVTSQEQRDVITAKNAAKASARTERPRGESKTAVVAVGSLVGHMGHQQLFSEAIALANKTGGDPYLFIGNAEGPDDPIPPAVKVQTWNKLYPQYAKNISTVDHKGGSLLQKIKHELINPLPGKPPRYDTVWIVVGKDRKAMAEQFQAALMKVTKFPGYEHVKIEVEVTERDEAAGGSGMSFTKMRQALSQSSVEVTEGKWVPTETAEQKFAFWNNGFNGGNYGAQKLPPNWIKHLMDISGNKMQIQPPAQQPAVQQSVQQPVQQKQPVPQPQQEPLAEQRLFNALLKPLNEGTSIDSTLRAIINDIGEPITSVYDTMKFQAKKYMENHGELGRGFRMVAAGVGGRWVQNMYVGRLHNELHDLCKYNTRRTGELRDFLRGEESNGEIEMKRSFGNLASNLPPILAKLGEQINAPQLTRNARRWMQNKAEYERYLMDLEAESNDELDDELDDEPAIKPPKSNVVGQQNAQVDQIVNDILSKIPKHIAGEIRNAIARSPNKLSALKQELNKHHVTMSEDNDAMSHMAKDLTGHGSPIAKAAAQRDKKREQHGAQSHGRAEGPKWNAVEGQKRKKKKTSSSLSRYFFPGYGYYGGGDSGEDGGDGGGESVNTSVAEEETNHWYDAGVKDATRGAIPNPRTYLPTLKDKQAKHPEEVYFYMQGYKSVKQGVAESLLNELTGYGSDKKYDYSGTHKRYEVYVSKQKFNNLYFIAVAENPRTLEAKFKAKGNNPQEAVNNLKLEIDKEIDVATKVSGQAILDFNVEFAKDILEMSTDVFYAKIIVGPRLVIAGPEMMEYPDIMRDEGFKPSAIRTYKGGEGTTKLPGVQLSSKAAAAANLIANGRYVLGNETVDKDGNRVFELNFDSVVQAKNDRMRLRAPALTVGTNRLQGVAEGSLEELANTSLKVKEPKNFVNTNDRKQVVYKVMKFKSDKDTYLINFTVKSAPAFGKKQNWNAVNVAFGVKEEQDDYSFGDEIDTDLTARNKNQFLIYSTVINAVRKFITEYNTEIDEIIMQGAGERQAVMYQRFFQSAGKYFPGWHHDGKHSLVRDVPRQTEKKVKEQGVAENTAAGINKMFNNLGDPVYANLQRVALLAMQGRQSEATERLQTVIKDASTDIQKKITDAVNNIKPVTINGRVADSSTLDKSKQHNDWIINTFIPWVQSLLGQQGVAEAPMSAAARWQRAMDRQRAKSDASLARTPSSIPKPEPKKDEKIAEKIKGADGKACWKGKRYAGTKNGKDVCIPVSEDVENIMDALINKIIVNEAVSNNSK